MPTNLPKAPTSAITFIKYFRAIDVEMPSQFIEVFLTIGSDPGITTKGLMEKTGLSQSAMSRVTRALSDRQMSGENGHNLVHSTPSPTDTRVLQWTLTPTGHSLYNAVLGTFSGEPGPPPTAFARPQTKKSGRVKVALA